eukprot:tig00000113_g5645.t1
MARAVYLPTPAEQARTFFTSAGQREMTLELWAKLPRVAAFQPGGDERADLVEVPGYLLVTAMRAADGDLALRVDLGGNLTFATTSRAAEAEYWTHYALVFTVDGADPSPNATRVAAYVNFTAAGEQWTGAAPRALEAIGALDWGFEIAESPFAVRRNFRVWRRALSLEQLFSNRFRRIWGGADNYTTLFPDLKINIPFDFYAPGSVFTLGGPPNNDVDCAALGIDTAAPSYGPVYWTACHCDHCLFAPEGTATTDPNGGGGSSGGDGSGGSTGTAGNSTGGSSSGGSTGAQCYPPAPVPPLTATYQISCPPSLTIPRVGPVNVTAGGAGAPKPLCGARMPDLRYLIAGDWSDPRVGFSQHPEAGAFLPGPLDTPATSTDADWLASGYGGPFNASIRASLSITNPTDVGPRGACSFDLFVKDDGPPLYPGACPPPLRLVPIACQPGTGFGPCAINFPDLRPNVTRRIDCIPPVPAKASDYVQESASGSYDNPNVQPGATWQDQLPMPPYSRSVRAYVPDPWVTWKPVLTGSHDAVNTSAVAAGADARILLEAPCAYLPPPPPHPAPPGPVPPSP